MRRLLGYLAAATSVHLLIAALSIAFPAAYFEDQPHRAPVTSGKDTPALYEIGAAHSLLGGMGSSSYSYVRELNGFAYVGSLIGAHACFGAVHVFDVRDPQNSRRVSSLAGYQMASSFLAIPKHVETPYFRGDLLVVDVSGGISTYCEAPPDPSGLAMFDVTDPAHPQSLGFFPLDAKSGERGSAAEVVTRNGRVLALVTILDVDGKADADLRIVDVTDPIHPREVSNWKRPAEDDRYRCSYGTPAAVSVRASPDGQRAYVGFYGAGVYVVDITYPDSPSLLTSLVGPDVDRSGLIAEEVRPGLAIVVESGYAAHFAFETQTLIQRTEMEGCTAIDPTFLERIISGRNRMPLRGSLVDIGTGCGDFPQVAAGIALATPDECSLADISTRAGAEGYRAVIAVRPTRVVPRSANPTVSSPVRSPIAAVVVIQPEDARSLRERLRWFPVSVTLPTRQPSMGVQIWDWSQPERPILRSEYRVGRPVDESISSVGVFAMNDLMVVDHFAIINWSQDGVRVLDIQDVDQPFQASAWIPKPDSALPTAFTRAGNRIYVSDAVRGLWILQLSGIPDEK